MTHMVVDIDNGILNKPDSYLEGCFWNDDKTRHLLPAEVRRIAREFKAKGFEVVPGCDNYDERGYCQCARNPT